MFHNDGYNLGWLGRRTKCLPCKWWVSYQSPDMQERKSQNMPHEMEAVGFVNNLPNGSVWRIHNSIGVYAETKQQILA